MLYPCIKYKTSYKTKMIIPIKCVTCGNVLADKYQWYLRRIREKQMAQISPGNDADDQKSRTAPDTIYLTKTHNTKTPAGETLDELGLFRDCCRRHMLTHVNI